MIPIEYPEIWRCRFCHDDVKRVGSFLNSVRLRPNMLFPSQCPARPLDLSGGLTRYGYHEVEEQPAKQATT